MSSREVIELPHALIEVEARPGYLFIIETGSLDSMSELKRYTARLDAMARRLQRTKALIDARGEVGDPSPEIRKAMWEWLTGVDRTFERVAFVLATEMAVARVNMTALSRRAQLRAFDAIHAGQRWLLRDPRLSTAGTEPRIESSPPTGERRRVPRPSPTEYRITDAPADTVRRTDSDEDGGSQVA